VTDTDPGLDDQRRASGHQDDLHRLLGRGGMGPAHLARERELGLPIALKVLPKEFASVPE
jgi:serine/threonine protein kinase